MRRPSELQMCYQRNMLYALLATICIAALGSWYMVSLESDTPHESEFRTPIENIRVQDSLDQREEPIRAMRSVGGLNPYAGRHEGFLGFINLRPSVTTPEVEVPQPIYATDDEIDMLDKTTVSFSPEVGEDTGVYIPPDAEFVSNRAPEMYQEKEPVSRDVQIIRRIDPEYPWVAKDEGKEGKITVLVYIDSVGNLSTFPDWVAGEGIHTVEYTVNGESHVAQYAYQENPQGWYFAQNFLKVLPEWRFAPRIEHGQPVGALLRIRYTFCLGVNCLKYEFEQLTPSG